LRIARHFDRRAAGYSAKYACETGRTLFEHEKRRRLQLACSALTGHLNASTCQRVLDVGCGTGQFIRRLLAARPLWQATGIDVSSQMINEAVARAEQAALGDRACWQVRALQQTAETYDAVVSLGVLGYQEDQAKFLRQLAERVAPGGLLVLTFGNQASVLRRIHDVVLKVRDAIARECFARRTPTMRFRAIRLSRVDQVLSDVGLRRVRLQWLAYGLGIGRVPGEASVSEWAERWWGGERTGKWLAQVGIGIYRR